MLNRLSINKLKPLLEGIVWHWSATHYDWKPKKKSYHFVIDDKGQVHQVLSVWRIGAHTWMRNTGRIGIAWAAKAKGYPVTKIQIERMACLTAELMDVFDISLDDVHDHAYFAKLDCYWPLRWDIGDKEPLVRNATKYYYNRIQQRKKRGERPYELINNLF